MARIDDLAGQMTSETKASIYDGMAHFEAEQVLCLLDRSVRPHLEQDCLITQTSSPFPVLSLFKPKARAGVLKRIHGHWTFFFPAFQCYPSYGTFRPVAEPSLPGLRTGASLLEFQLHANHLLPSVFSLCSGMFHDNNTLPLS